MSRVVELTSASWDDEVTQSKTPVMVEFWAEWCAPCRMMAQTIDAVAERLEGRVKVAKLNIDEHPSVSERYDILGIPTVILFESGTVKDQIVGVTSEDVLLDWLDPQSS